MTKKPKNDDLLRTKIKHGLTFRLTEKELGEKGTAMAELDQVIQNLETEFDAVKAKWKAEIALEEKKRREISRIVLAGSEMRTVDCEEIRDYVENSVKYEYHGIIMEERVMQADERQAVLAIEEKPKPITKRRTRPGNGKDAADFKKASAGDVIDADFTDADVGEDLAAVIKAETSRKSKRSSTDGPTSKKDI